MLKFRCPLIHASRHVRSGISAVLCLLGLSAMSPPVEATEVCQARGSDRPSIGLVLGGGGARGSAHIGVIKALEEMNVPIDCVVGTSMGSLVGGFYASGMTVPEMEETLSNIDWAELFNDNTPRDDQPYRRKREDQVFALYGPKIGLGSDASILPTGLISGQKINFLFETLVSERVHTNNFDELALPFRAVATDLLTGDKVVLDQGNLALAMRASMSVPAVFDPVDLDGYLLVDGGISDNLPVDVARSLGADIVIAVDVGSGGMKREDVKNVLSVVAQLSSLMFMENSIASRASLTEQDILIRPALPEDFTGAAFDRAVEGAKIGYDTSSGQRAEIERLGLSQADYADYVATVNRTMPAAPVIEFVNLYNESGFSDDLILRQLDVSLGEPLDASDLKADIRRIYGLGFLELVRYEIVDDNGKQGLNLYVEPDSRGSRYLEWGLDLFSDKLADGFNFRAAYLMTDIDDLGSEFRVMGQMGNQQQAIIDLYKYIDPSASWGIDTRLFAESSEFIEFSDGEPIGVTDLRLWGGHLAFGREFGRRAVAAAGVRAYTGSVKREIGEAQPKEDFDAGEWFASATYDRLDNRYIPDDGLFIRADYNNSADWLGSDDDYKQVLFTGIAVRSFGPHTFLAASKVYTTVDGIAPTYALFTGGGLYSLSGFNGGQIAGQNLGIIAGSYQHKFKKGFLAGRLGVSLEYGGITDDYKDLFSDGDFHGSLFAAFRTPVGPAYLGYGWGDGGAQNWFLRMGRIFGNQGAVR